MQNGYLKYTYVKSDVICFLDFPMVLVSLEIEGVHRLVDVSIVLTVLFVNHFQDDEQTKKPRKKFSKKQLRAGHCLLTLQTGTNQFASQKGMSFGSVRHGADIRADDLVKDGEGELTQQAATNRFCTQSGMTSFGAVRHVSDIKVKQLYDEGDADEYPTDEEEEYVPTKSSKSSRREEADEEGEAKQDAEAE